MRLVGFVTACVAIAPALVSRAAPLAMDHAGDPAYADGWQTGDNGGFGFGPWALEFNNFPGGEIQHPSAHFIDTPPPLPGNGLGSPAFGMTAANASFSSGDYTGANRRFLVPIVAPGVFQADVDGPSLQSPGAFPKHIDIQLLAADNQILFHLWAGPESGTLTWRVGGTFTPANPGLDTRVPSDTTFRLEFTRKTLGTYDLVMRPLSGGAPLFSLTNGVIGVVPIDSLRITHDNASSAGGTFESFFNNFLTDVPEPAGLAPPALAGLALLRRRSRRCRC